MPYNIKLVMFMWFVMMLPELSVVSLQMLKSFFFTLTYFKSTLLQANPIFSKKWRAFRLICNFKGFHGGIFSKIPVSLSIKFNVAKVTAIQFADHLVIKFYFCGNKIWRSKKVIINYYSHLVVNLLFFNWSKFYNTLVAVC